MPSLCWHFCSENEVALICSVALKFIVLSSKVPSLGEITSDFKTFISVIGWNEIQRKRYFCSWGQTLLTPMHWSHFWHSVAKVMLSLRWRQTRVTSWNRSCAPLVSITTSTRAKWCKTRRGRSPPGGTPTLPSSSSSVQVTWTCDVMMSSRVSQRIIAVHWYKTAKDTFLAVFVGCPVGEYEFKCAFEQAWCGFVERVIKAIVLWRHPPPPRFPSGPDPDNLITWWVKSCHKIRSRAESQLVLVFFRPSATVSRIGLSHVCAGVEDPTTPLAGWPPPPRVMDVWGARPLRWLSVLVSPVFGPLVRCPRLRGHDTVLNRGHIVNVVNLGVYFVDNEGECHAFQGTK